MSKEFKNLTALDKAYIAGFLDGDGSIMVQIVRDNTRKFKFYIRVSIGFYQNTKHHWFVLWLQEAFSSHGYITKRATGMSEFTIVAKGSVLAALTELYPYLKIKKPLCKLALEILNETELVKTEADFLKVCRKVDKVAEHTYSKTRKITTQTVCDVLKLPVETSD